MADRKYKRFVDREEFNCIHDSEYFGEKSSRVHQMREWILNRYSSGIGKARELLSSPSAITWAGGLIVGSSAAVYVLHSDFMGSYYGYYTGFLSAFFVGEVLLSGGRDPILGSYIYHLMAATMALIHAFVFVFSARIIVGLAKLRFPDGVARNCVVAWLVVYLVVLIGVRLPGHPLFWF